MDNYSVLKAFDKGRKEEFSNFVENSVSKVSDFSMLFFNRYIRARFNIAISWNESLVLSRMGLSAPMALSSSPFSS